MKLDRRVPKKKQILPKRPNKKQAKKAKFGGKLLSPNNAHFISKQPIALDGP